MAFTNPQIHDVDRVWASCQRIDHRPDGGEPFACLHLHLTAANGKTGTVQAFFPDGAQEYAAQLAEAINQANRNHELARLGKAAVEADGEVALPMSEQSAA